MGKRIRAQRIGRGTSVYKSLRHRKKGDVTYQEILPLNANLIRGSIEELMHESGRMAPLAVVKLEDGRKTLYLPPEGVHVGKEIYLGPDASPETGNILPLGSIPEGTKVFNIEKTPGDGGKFVRSAGTFGIVIGLEENKVKVKLPSGEIKRFNPNCRATIGVVAGGGFGEKPMLKAGSKHYLMRSKGKKWPIVRGVAMNPVDHPHGGGSHQHVGAPTTVSRHAPPGAKVGHIAAKKTGRGKKSRKK